MRQSMPNLQQVLQATLDAVPATIAILNERGKIIAVNESWRRFAQANQLCWDDYGIGRNYLDVCRSARGEHAEEAREAFQGISEVILNRRKEFQMEYPCHSPRERRWYMMWAVPLTEWPVRAVVTHLNVTEQKLAEGSLAESEKRFRDLVELSPEAVSIVAEEKIVYISRAGAELLGASAPEELMGRKVSDLIHPEFYDLVSRRLAQAMEERRQVPQIELKMVRLDGSIVYVEGSAGPMMEKDRPAVLCFFRDITERKRRESALSESEKRYSTLVESSLTGIFVVQDEKIVFANRRFAEMHGYRRREVIGLEALSLIHPDDRYALGEITRTGMEEKHPHEYEIRALKKNGEVFWIRMINSLIRQEGRPAVLGNVMDVTRGKEMEENLKKTSEELRFLSSRLMNAQEDERKRIARELHDSTAQSLALMKMILRSSTEGMDETSPVHYSVQLLLPMMQETIEDVRRIISNLRPSILDNLGILATISWHCRGFERIHRNIHIQDDIYVQESEVPDPLKIVIYRILQEGLNNVSKHSGAASVSVLLKKEAGELLLVIEDNGSGFDLEEISTRDFITRGIGLSSMKERVELSGGSFRLSSAKGKGTKISAAWTVTH